MPLHWTEIVSPSRTGLRSTSFTSGPGVPLLGFIWSTNGQIAIALPTPTKVCAARMMKTRRAGSCAAATTRSAPDKLGKAYDRQQRQSTPAMSQVQNHPHLPHSIAVTSVPPTYFEFPKLLLALDKLPDGIAAARGDFDPRSHLLMSSVRPETRRAMLTSLLNWESLRL
jgi:hypothetical protein